MHAPTGFVSQPDPAQQPAYPPTRLPAAGPPRGPLDRARAQLLLRRVPLQGQRDQPIEQVGIAHTARLPQLAVHADRREARERVHFVQQQLTVAAAEQKVDPRQARAAGVRWN